MEGIHIARAAAYIGAALSIGIGSIGPAYGQGLIGTKSCENVGKYPENVGTIRTTMLIAMAVVESSAIYAFIVSLLLIILTP